MDHEVSFEDSGSEREKESVFLTAEAAQHTP